MTTELTALPSPPLPGDSQGTFNAKAFAFWAAMPQLREQINAAIQEILDTAGAAGASSAAASVSRADALDFAGAAAASAMAAASSAGAVAWVPDAIYAIGDRRWSLINQQLYRRTSAGAGAFDPSIDSANWARIWIQPDLVTAESLFFASI